jgi:predicted SAM-dependent methyltransferase
MPSDMVLEIGPGINPQAHNIYTDSKVITMDMDIKANPDVIADANYPLPFVTNAFEGIFASHILEHITFWRELAVLEEWQRCLRPGGILHVLVPSWEWVARNVLAENPSPATKPLAFAGQTSPWDVHLNMFTMRQLRSLFEKAGLMVIKARTGQRYINVGNLGVFPTEQHYVAGVKGGYDENQGT